MSYYDQNFINLFGLFIAILSAQCLLHWLRIRHLSETLNFTDRQIKESQLSNFALGTNCDRQRFEIEWLHTALSENSSGRNFLKLIQRWSSHPEAFHGWLIYPDGTEDALRQGHQPADALVYFPLKKNYCELIRSQRPQVFVDLPSDINSLYLVRCNPDLTKSSVLVFTHLPSPLSADEGIQRLSEMARHLKCHTASDPTPILEIEQSQEFNIAHEMLEIRSLLDVEFQTPQEMMQGFLMKLAKLSGYESASLYLKHDNPPDDQLFLHFARGATIYREADLCEWKRGEEMFIERADLVVNSPLLLTSETIFAMNSSIPFRCGILLPVVAENECLGILFLTHSESTHPSNEDAQLCDWAASFLIQTLQREMSRMETLNQARRDPLTQLANRRTFDYELNRFLNSASQSAETCSLILLDIDHFKSVNDLYGHQSGDLALKKVAACLAEKSDKLEDASRMLAARYGGEEFALLLPDVDMKGALEIAEEVRKEIENMTLELETASVSLTASFGVSTQKPDKETSESLIRSADQALYLAKTTGRNRVCSEEDVHNLKAPLQDVTV